MKKSNQELIFKKGSKRFPDLIHQVFNYQQMQEQIRLLGINLLYQNEFKDLIKEIDKQLKKNTIKKMEDAIFHFQISEQEKLLDKDFIVHFSTLSEEHTGKPIIKGCFVLATTYMWKRAIKVEEITIRIWQPNMVEYSTYTFKTKKELDESFSPTPKTQNRN